jgi:hypothetical protein
VSTELRARLWPVLVGGDAAHAYAPPQSTPASPALTSRDSIDGRASPVSTAAAAPPLPSPGHNSCLGPDYEEWAAGEHKDRTTVRRRGGMQHIAHSAALQALKGPLLHFGVHSRAHLHAGAKQMLCSSLAESCASKQQCVVLAAGASCSWRRPHVRHACDAAACTGAG